eukprot:g4819.t1
MLRQKQRDAEHVRADAEVLSNVSELLKAYDRDIESCALSSSIDRNEYQEEESSEEKVRVGACYNVFDGEELLEASILSISKAVEYVVVVYQRESNFGEACSDNLMSTLEDLERRGLVTELVEYCPRRFSASEKENLCSSQATGVDLGGARARDISDVFLNELSKREIGRQKCLSHGCTHFMSLDCDECYKCDDLLSVISRVRGYDAVCCRMRYFFKYTRCELVPEDDLNWVPALFRLDADLPFRLGHPYPVMVDPTRRVSGARRVMLCERDELEMYHYSFVRRDVQRKLRNVSNRGNYNYTEDFQRAWARWQPPQRPGSVHPHPFFRERFEGSRIVPDWFGIAVEGTALPHSCVSPDGLRRAASVLFKAKRYGDALRLYEEILTLNIAASEQRTVRLNMAMCDLQMGRHESCIERCTALIDVLEGKALAKALFRRGLSFFSAKEPASWKEKARADLFRAQQLCPADKSISRLLSVSFLWILFCRFPLQY